MIVKKRDIEALLLALIFCEISIVPHSFFIVFKYIVVILLLFSNIKSILKIKEIAFCILFYCGITIVSSFYNNMSINSCIAAIVFALFVMDMFLVVYNYMKYSNIRNFVMIFWRLFGIFILVNDVLMLVLKYDFTNSAELYLLGNKFGVAYMHLFVFILSIYLNSSSLKKNILMRNIIVLVAVISLFICFKVNCATGIISICASIMLCLIPERIVKQFCKPLYIFGLLVVMNYLIFGSVAIFTNASVESFIVNILHKNANMTGRLHIYAGLFTIIMDSPIIGYGYYSSVVNRLLFGNAQNGIMKIVIDSGILGLAGYLGIMFFAIRKSIFNFKMTRPFIIFLLSMIVASSVEICLTEHIVFLAYAVLYSIGCFGQKEIEIND